MKRLLPAVVLGLSLLAPLFAQPRPGGGNQQNQQSQQQRQQQDEDGPRRLPFPLWKAELPAGSYLVARNAISAVSTQQYVLDGVARVTEVNVTTNGNFHPRFYYLEMLDTSASADTPGAQIAREAVLAAAKEGAERVDSDASSKVVKNYPATTHASTIEFRLPSAEAVQKLYESVTRVWLTGESEVYTPEGTHRMDPSKEIKPAEDAQGSGGPGTNSGGTN